MNKEWLDAAILIGKEPNAAVLCPENPDHGFLAVTDHYVPSSDVFERRLACPKCGAFNVMRKRIEKS